VHDEHAPVATSHPAVGPVHFVRFVAEQTPHAPEGSQAGVAPPHSASVEQARHAWVVASHAGFVPEHCAPVAQPTQVPVPTSQAEVVPAQRRVFVAEHAPHAPPGWHAGVAPLQSVSPPHARQTCVVLSQTGGAPPQSVFPTHATQEPVVASQPGVAPEHALLFVAEHAPHDPFAWHAGAAPPQSPSAVQPRQVCVEPLHVGVMPLQSAFATHVTHVPDVVLQSSVEPVHAVLFVAEQPPQAPVG
jgi:hypothetical protein